MSDFNIVLPSKPKIVSQEGNVGVYEIDSLYPGYGHTLGNSLRRIILSSLPGAAITSVKIDGVSHEFSTIAGVKEDVITILLNLKKVRIKMLSSEPQTLTLHIKGAKEVTAGDIKTTGQIEVLNPEQALFSVTEKNATVDMEFYVEGGIGYVAKDVLHKNRVDIGSIALDGIFTPIRKVNYEVENMRVGNRTDFNRLKFFIETDGTISPKEALEKSIEIMIHQLKSIIGFKEEEVIIKEAVSTGEKGDDKEADPEFLKTRIETLGLSQRTSNALTSANIRTVGGLVRKKEKDILEIEGLGAKGLQELKDKLAEFNVSLKTE